MKKDFPDIFRLRHKYSDAFFLFCSLIIFFQNHIAIDFFQFCISFSTPFCIYCHEARVVYNWQHLGYLHCLFVCLSSQMKFIYKGNPFIFICDDRSSQMNHFHHKWNWRDFFVNWEEKLVSFWVLAILRKFLYFHLWWPHFMIFLPLPCSTDCRRRWKIEKSYYKWNGSAHKWVLARVALSYISIYK